MKQEQFAKWLEDYKSAWENRDPQAVQNLFTKEATYQEGPFDDPMRGIEAIYKYWAEVPVSQENISFASEILAVTDNRGIAHWKASFVRIPSGVRVRLDGIFVVALNEEGRCNEFKEWWHRIEK